MWDLGALDGLPSHFWQYGYIVFDDIEWDSIKASSKSWFGAQRDFAVSDKYRRKRRIPGGVPTIFLCNDDQFRDDLHSFAYSDWGRKNIDIVYIHNKLY